MSLELKKPNIVITLNSPLTENIYSRIGINHLIDYFEITLIDCLDYFNPEFNKNNSYEKYKTDTINIKKINSSEGISKVLDSKKPIFLLDCIGKSDKTIKIQTKCNEHNVTYVYDSLTSTILDDQRKNLILKTLSLFPHFITKMFSYLICNTFYKKDTYIRPDIILSSSKIGTLWENSARNIIFSSSKTYFDYLEVKDVNKKFFELEDGKYILFLDDCLLDSFDFQLGFNKFNTEKSAYFKSLDIFFKKLEEKFNMPVVIAAHPNGKNYENYAKQFGNRKVFFDSSCILTRNCLFSLTHYSLSCHYSILFNKFIVFMDLDFLPKAAKNIQKSYSKEINSTIIDITNNKEDLLDPMIVNKRLYQNFKKNYICASDDDIINPYEPLLSYFIS